MFATSNNQNIIYFATGHNPEVLSLANLAWNCGLPAGMHEVEIIERMRIKRAWEATLPPPDCEENVKAWACFIKTVEIDDWAFRESVKKKKMVIKNSKLSFDAFYGNYY